MVSDQRQNDGGQLGWKRKTISFHMFPLFPPSKGNDRKLRKMTGRSNQCDSCDIFISQSPATTEWYPGSSSSSIPMWPMMSPMAITGQCQDTARPGRGTNTLQLWAEKNSGPGDCISTSTSNKINKGDKCERILEDLLKFIDKRARSPHWLPIFTSRVPSSCSVIHFHWLVQNMSHTAYSHYSRPSSTQFNRFNPRFSSASVPRRWARNCDTKGKQGDHVPFHGLSVILCRKSSAMVSQLSVTLGSMGTCSRCIWWEPSEISVSNKGIMN